MSTTYKTYFKNLEEATLYLNQRISNPTLINLLKTYHDQMTFAGIEYYIAYDFDFAREYNTLLNEYVLFFLKSETSAR
jgi:hypothetical protein